MNSITECPNWRDLTSDNIYKLQGRGIIDSSGYKGGCIVECDKMSRANICCLQCLKFSKCPDDHKRKCTRKLSI